MKAVYRESFRVRSYELDPLGRLQIPILCKLLQEVATTHATLLGVGVDTLIDSGVAWVLSRLDLQMKRWPGNDDEIVVETWPAAMNRLLTERRFRILGSAEQEIGNATTVWLILDLERRRPVRLPPHVVERLQEVDLKPEPVRPAELPLPDTAALEFAFTVRRSDVDLAGHANNTSFVEWAVEAVPDEVWRTGDLHELGVQFLAECHRRQTVLSRSDLTGSKVKRGVRHQLVREEDGVEVARAHTVWARNTPSFKR